MLPRNPRAFGLVLAAIGLGVVLWYGEQRARLPQWSEAEIAQSVELNLQLDLQRRGPHLQPSEERLEALRRTLRAEVEAEIRREREQLDRWIGAGLLLLVFGAGQWFADVLRRRASH
jgi:uncharacterized protein HemX